LRPNAEQMQRLLALDSIPLDARTSIAEVITAFTAYQRAARSTFATVDSAMLEAASQGLIQRTLWSRSLQRAISMGERPFLQKAAVGSLRLDGLFLARMELLDAVERLGAAQASLHGVTVAPIQFARVLSISLGSTDDTYSSGFALSIDVGGNDVYRNNAGGSNITGSACSTPGTIDVAAAAIDLGGTDQYLNGASCGINGGGYFGSGLLVDSTGSDVYTAGDKGTNGGALGGAGLLIDARGDDRYSGIRADLSFGSNGGGVDGFGALIDGGGNDRYDGGLVASNGGGAGGLLGAYGVSPGAGVGFLADLGGNDQYNGLVDSTNGGGSLGGGGFLMDLAGSDSYVMYGGGANGGGFFGGVGFLFDAIGSDRYLPPSDAGGGAGAGANGGAHLGVGMLIDGLGRDLYVAGDDGSNGGGSSGAGFLIDTGGGDTYVAGDRGANGGGATYGAGLLVDLAGNDFYYVSGSQGTNGGVIGGKIFRTGLAGLLFDGSGTDVYIDPYGSCTDCSVIPKPRLGGAQVDVALPPS
jgi:hypothetical protein